MATSKKKTSKKKQAEKKATVTVRCMVAFETDGSVDVCGYLDEDGDQPADERLHAQVEDMLSSSIAGSYFIELELPRPIADTIKMVPSS